MQLAEVRAERCTGHKKCPAGKACPTKALLQLDPGETATVDVSLCRGCGDCVSACPDQAINIRQA